MIIFEGPDNVGKTTAAQKMVELLEEHDVRYRHCRGMPGFARGRPDDDFDYHEGYLRQVDHSIVQDRFHVGGLVYGFLCGLHSTRIKRWKFRTLLQTLRQQGCFTIIMYHGNDDAYARSIMPDAREQMYHLGQNVGVNATYRILVRQGRWIDVPICDVSFDIAKGFPTEQEIRAWIAAYETSRP